MTTQNSTEITPRLTHAPSLKLSKLDAARRQLETAVALCFQEGDPVSIHSFACAAHEIVETLNAMHVPHDRYVPVHGQTAVLGSESRRSQAGLTT